MKLAAKFSANSENSGSLLVLSTSPFRVVGVQGGGRVLPSRRSGEGD